MRGEFENIWNDAFEGASITPSEEVWNGIASRMDSAGGKRNWVTILLIAATVTVAFAFPLTVGNSEYDFKPMAAEIAASQPIERTPESVPEAVVGEQPGLSAEVQVSNSSGSTTLAAAGGENNKIEVQETSLEKESIAYASNVMAKGDYQLHSLQEHPGSLLDNYYILPAFRSEEDDYNKALLAYGNINMASQSASSGFNDFNLLQASADFERAPDLSYGAGDNRSEDGGMSFYVGFGAEIPVAKRINLTAGLGYQNQRLNGSSNTIYEENGQQYPLGIYDPIRPGTIYLAENYDYVSNNQFISLPVGVKYALVDKEIKLRFGLGVSPDFMLSHKVSAAEYGTFKTSLDETAYNTVQFTGLLNLDVMIPLQASYGLAIETGVRQGLVPYVENGSQYTTAFNLGVILFYQLRK